MSEGLERLRRVFAARRAPEFVLGIGALMVAVYAASYGVRVTEFALDEAVIKQQAVNYTSGLPGSLFHDLAARGPSRLYSLVQSIVFRGWSGDAAIRHAKELNAVMFASTACPVWLLAKRLLDSRWAAVTAGLLAIACPWLALTTTIFTENLSYPLFAWTLATMAWCIDKPSARRDLAVVILVALLTVTRVQLFTIFIWWPLAVLALDLLADDQRGSPWRRLIMTVKRVVPAHPFSFGAVALGVLYVFWLAMNNTLQAKFRADLGTYSEIGYRDKLPANYLTGLFAEVVHFSAALGVLPVVAAFVYWTRALGDRSDRRWRIVGVVVVVAVGMSVATLFAQGGYAGATTEERYYMYLIPLAWIGALGLLQLDAVRTSWLVSSAGVVVLLFAVVPIATPLTTEYVFLAAGGSAAGRLVAAIGNHLGGMTERDTLAWIGFIVCFVAIGLWVHRPRWRAAWIVAPAAFQIVLTLYVFSAIDGNAQGVPSRTHGDFKSLSFVDRNVKGDVTWLDAQRKPYNFDAEARQRFALFWNQRISDVAMDLGLGIPPVSFPLSSVTTGAVEVDPRTGRVTTSLPLDHVVAPTNSPFLQLATKRVISRSQGDDLELIEPAKPVRAVWNATGLLPNGTIERKPARLRAWGPGRIEVSMTFGPAPPTDGGTPGEATTARVRFGHRTAVVSPIASQKVLTFSGCAEPGRPLIGAVSALRGKPELVSVRLRRTSAC